MRSPARSAGFTAAIPPKAGKRHIEGDLPVAAKLNYRIWAAGALVSNIGSWMQRTAQDWIVLTELTHRNATAVGIVMGLQFGPQILLLPLTGYAADHLDRRKLLFCTQAAMGLLALGLGLLVVTGVVQLVARLCVCIPAGLRGRIRFAGAADLRCGTGRGAPSAERGGLNSTSFNAARMIGPAIAGGLIAGVGSGWVFLINALSFLAVLGSLSLLRRAPAAGPAVAPSAPAAACSKAFAMSCGAPDLKVILFMLFLIGTFGLNFPIFISTMAVTVFHAGAGQYRTIDLDDGGGIGDRRIDGGGAGPSPAFRCCSPAPRSSASAARRRR